MRLQTTICLLLTLALWAGEGLPATDSGGAPAGPAASPETTPGHDSSGPGKVAAAGRRDRLVDLLRPLLPPGRPGAFYLAAAEEDFPCEFRQDANFYYLTGLDTALARMAIFFDEERAVERIYLRAVPDHWERYIGDVLEPGTVDGELGGPDGERARALRATGFRGEGASDPEAVRKDTAVLEDLKEWLGRRGILFLAGASSGDEGPALETGSVPWKLLEKRRRIEVRSADSALHRLRLVKSPDEVAKIRRAVEITCEAHHAAMSALHPGVPEYAVEGVIEHAFIGQGARYSAFPSVVGSGPNSTVLHYYRNDRRVGENELVVIDIGAEFQHYAADVTRTLPSSGAFTAGQREIYELVLRAQQEAMKEARPGSSISKIDARAREIVKERGLEEAYWHSCCHYVGLEVHDVGDRDAQLEPGMVLTVEPGIYLPEREIGVRIEDTILITETGHEVLSECAPSYPDRIESLMSGEKVSRGAPASRPR